MCRPASPPPPTPTRNCSTDTEALAHVFDENDPAVTRLIEILLPRVQALGSPVGLCGQRPSDDPAYAAFLVRAGIDSISVAPRQLRRRQAARRLR